MKEVRLATAKELLAAYPGWLDEHRLKRLNLHRETNGWACCVLDLPQTKGFRYDLDAVARFIEGHRVGAGDPLGPRGIVGTPLTR